MRLVGLALSFSLWDTLERVLTKIGLRLTVYADKARSRRDAGGLAIASIIHASAPLPSPSKRRKGRPRKDAAGSTSTVTTAEETGLLRLAVLSSPSSLETGSGLEQP